MSSSGSPPPEPAEHGTLARVLGVPGAVLMGLGSIVGTGIFVTIALAAGIAGSSVLIAIGIAAVVATCNGLASAQLAAAHPVSGGAYEYAYRYASPSLGRLAGATFVCAKTASAATAALGFAGYALAIADHASHRAQIGIAAAIVVALTLVVAGGMTRSHRLNVVLVVTTLASLAIFVIATLPDASLANLSISDRLTGDATRLGDIAHATALVFVAYTGYGRIATLGEEVRDPAHTIPRAMIITLAVIAALYLLVTTTALAAVGAPALALATRETNAPLEVIAPSIAQPAIAVGAATAMLGVLLNLLLGISRVLLAMARRRDLPTALARVHHSSPRRAVLLTGLAMVALTLVGSIKTTWTLSAFTVLVYYAINNICALRQPAAERRFPRAIPAAGLLSCTSLAIWIAARALA